MEDWERKWEQQEKERKRRMEHLDWVFKVSLKRLKEEKRLDYARAEQARRRYEEGLGYDICEDL